MEIDIVEEEEARVRLLRKERDEATVQLSRLGDQSGLQLLATAAFLAITATYSASLVDKGWMRLAVWIGVYMGLGTLYGAFVTFIVLKPRENRAAARLARLEQALEEARIVLARVKRKVG